MPLMNGEVLPDNNQTNCITTLVFNQSRKVKIFIIITNLWTTSLSNHFSVSIKTKPISCKMNLSSGAQAYSVVLH